MRINHIKKLTSLCSVLVLVAISACRKDPQPFPLSCGECDLPDTLEFGNTTNMNVFSPGWLYNSYPYQNDSILIDLENDGEPDFKIKTIIYSGGVMVGYYPHTSVESMNDSAWFSFSTTDTTYFYIDTTYSGSSPTYRQINYRTTCVAIPGYDSVISIKNKVNYHSAGDNLMMTDAWTGSKIYLHSPSKKVYGDLGTPVNDTITSYDSYYTYFCKNIPAVPTYIGIKKTKGGIERLGWIKLTISNEGWHVALEEFALQGNLY